MKYDTAKLRLMRLDADSANAAAGGVADAARLTREDSQQTLRDALRQCQIDPFVMRGVLDWRHGQGARALVEAVALLDADSRALAVPPFARAALDAAAELEGQAAALSAEANRLREAAAPLNTLLAACDSWVSRQTVNPTEAAA
jgi:hypothetical protein